MTTDALPANYDPQAAAAAVQQMLADSGPVAPQIAPPLPGFVRLPGGFVRGGVGSEPVYDAEVRELTGNDEEYIDRVRRGKPGKLVEAILERGVAKIGDEPVAKHDIRGLLLADAEKLLIEIRRATYGDTMEFAGLTCPKCADVFDLTIEIDDIPETRLENSEDRFFEVPLRAGKKAHVRLPRISDIPELGGEPTSAEYNTALLANVILSVEKANGEKTPVSGSTSAAQSLGLADRQSVLVGLGERSVGPDRNKVTFTHDCGEEVPFPISVGDLFPGL